MTILGAVANLDQCDRATTAKWGNRFHDNVSPIPPQPPPTTTSMATSASNPRLSRYKLDASFSGNGRKTVTHITVRSNLEAGQRRIKLKPYGRPRNGSVQGHLVSFGVNEQTLGSSGPSRSYPERSSISRRWKPWLNCETYVGLLNC